MSTLPPPTHDDTLDELLAVAQRLVEQAQSRGADAAECFIQTAGGRSLSVERNQLAATEESGEAGIALRLFQKQRTTFTYFTNVEAAGRSIDQALDTIRQGPKTKAELPGQTPAPQVEGLWDTRLIDREGDALAEDARILIEAAREIDPSINVAGGSVGIAAEAYAIANSEGLQAGHRGTEGGVGLYVVAKKGDDVATGQYSHEATTLDDLLQDPARVARTAAERAKDLLGAKTMEHEGKTQVVFTPQAFSSILEFMLLPAFVGERAARGESLYSGREEETVADARLRLIDDPTRPGGLGSAPTCDEGLPSRSVPLLADGKISRFLHDVGSAYKWGDGAQSLSASGLRTGGLSDGRSYQDPPTTTPRNIVLESSDATDLDRLIGGIDDGLFVVDVLGAHTGNRTSGDFSVTSTQLWRIKDGERREGIAGAMLSGNLPDLLRDAYLGTSKQREQVSGHFSPTGLDLPYVALGDVTRVPA